LGLKANGLDFLGQARFLFKIRLINRSPFKEQTILPFLFDFLTFVILYPT
jgi:hypothetical protein